MNSSDALVGMQLARSGRFAEALPFLDRANRRAPADVPLLHAVATLLFWADRGGDAVERYRRAASLMPEDVSVLSGWARALLLVGDRRQSLLLFERAIALDPDYANPGGLFDQLLREAIDVDTACPVLQTLVGRHPSHGGLRSLYGAALLTAGHLQEAQTTFERLRELRPYDPRPLVELGALAVSRGDRAMALDYYLSALNVDPSYVAALWGFAQVSGWRLDEQTLASAQGLLQSERDPRALAGLHDMLARHDDRGRDYTSAASHVMHANKLKTQIVPPQKRYDPRQHEIEIDTTIRDNGAELFQKLRNAGNANRRPVFVIGLPRSGTTLLEQMLAAHPEIVGVGEQYFAAASQGRAIAASAGSFAMLTAQAVGEAAAWHLQMLEMRALRMGIGRHAERIVDKLPDNYLMAGWLRIAFPNAAIIHCLRDPRDVALSCWMTQFADVQWSLDLQHIVHRIEQHRRLLRHWRSTIGDRLTEIRYEHLVADPEAQLRRVLAAMELEWHPGVLAFADRKGFVASASRQQVREPIHARSVARWRNYEHALRPILQRLDAIAAQDALDADSW